MLNYRNIKKRVLILDSKKNRYGYKRHYKEVKTFRRF